MRLCWQVSRTESHPWKSMTRYWFFLVCGHRRAKFRQQQPIIINNESKTHACYRRSFSYQLYRTKEGMEISALKSVVVGILLALCTGQEWHGGIEQGLSLTCGMCHERNSKLIGFVLNTQATIKYGPEDCNLWCLLNPECGSFNYEAALGVCELNKFASADEEYTDGLEPDATFSFYSPCSWKPDLSKCLSDIPFVIIQFSHPFVFVSCVMWKITWAGL